MLAARAIEILKTAVSISDIVLFACVGYFMHGLSWNVEKDRVSIIGFTWMLVTIAASVVFIWI